MTLSPTHLRGEVFRLKFSIVPGRLAIRLAHSDIWSKGWAMPLVFGGDNGRLEATTVSNILRRAA
jgi:hypothetical protein